MARGILQKIDPLRDRDREAEGVLLPPLAGGLVYILLFVQLMPLQGFV
jgi:hypothetical protein